MPDSLHILIKPASGNCNLRCRYCFYRDITENREQPSFGFMSPETQENMIRKAIAHASRECTFAYQGGEPTLIGIDYFRRSVELAKRFNENKIALHFAIQTNGYRLGEEWAKFFAENNFLVGLSLDGVAETNDDLRLTPKGKGTFNEVMKTSRLFDRFGVEYNILTVVNRRTARRIDRIYSFYRSCGFQYLQFIPCLDPIGEEPGKHEYSLTPKQYGDFLKTLFDLWYRDRKKGVAVFIRQFDNYLGMLLGYPPEECGMSGVCGIQNVVEADGSVYPCDFYVLDEYRLGSLNQNSFEEIDARRQELNFLKEALPHDSSCQECRYFPLCRGGCKRYREPCINGVYPKSYFCEAYRSFFEYSVPRLEELAADMSSARP